MRVGFVVALVAVLLAGFPAAAEEGEKQEEQEGAAFQELYEHPNKGKEAFKFELDRASLAINMRSQVQGAFLVGDDSLIENWDPATTRGFRLRRGRLGFHGDYDNMLGLNLVLNLYEQDAGGNTIHAANIVLRPATWANIALGTAPLPFSRGSMTSSARLQMIERAVTTTQLTPESQLGAAFLGSLFGGILEYAGGVYNGGPGYTKADRGDGLLYAARLQISPVGPMSSDESDYDQSPARVALGADYYYNDDSSVVTNAASVDLRFKWKGLALTGEYLMDRREPEDNPELPPSLPDTTEREGWYVQAGYFVVPKMVELAGRYEWYDDQKDIGNAGDLWLASGGLNMFFFDGYLKTQLNYIHRVERNVPEMDNNIVFAQCQVNL